MRTTAPSDWGKEPFSGIGLLLVCKIEILSSNERYGAICSHLKIDKIILVIINNLDVIISY